MPKKTKKGIELLLLTLLGVTGVIFLLSPKSLTSKLQFAFIRFFKGPINFCNNITSPKAQSENTTNIFNPYRYIQLRNHLANNIQLLHEQRQQLHQLNDLSDRYAWKGTNFVLADIITFSIDSTRADMIINRGTNDGLAQGQFVLGDYCVIGTIAQLDDQTSQVRLITDPASKLAVTIGQSNIDALMQGIGNKQAKINLLPTKHSVKKGDLVYARKKAGFLDASVIAGAIAQCQRSQENPLVWDIKVAPACNVRTLENVTVLVTTAPLQLENTHMVKDQLVTENQLIQNNQEN
jgi:rod shape-determining protein MreC